MKFIQTCFTELVTSELAKIALVQDCDVTPSQDTCLKNSAVQIPNAVIAHRSILRLLKRR